jgi:hypothetical protein
LANSSFQLKRKRKADVDESVPIYVNLFMTPGLNERKRLLGKYTPNN